MIKKKQKIINEEIKYQVQKKISENKVNKSRKDIADVCSLLEKCTIDEISKYLLKQGKKREFPDITKRQ